jgi:hypothetical protein
MGYFVVGGKQGTPEMFTDLTQDSVLHVAGTAFRLHLNDALSVGFRIFNFCSLMPICHARWLCMKYDQREKDMPVSGR